MRVFVRIVSDDCSSGMTKIQHAQLWGLLQQPPWEFVDIIHQDEYCIDLIMMLPDGLYLVFDTT